MLKVSSTPPPKAIHKVSNCYALQEALITTVLPRALIDVRLNAAVNRSILMNARLHPSTLRGGHGPPCHNRSFRCLVQISTARHLIYTQLDRLIAYTL